MEKNVRNRVGWTVCRKCQGQGKKRGKPNKKVLFKYKQLLGEFESSKIQGEPPAYPKRHFDICKNCEGTGLLSSTAVSIPDEKNYPHIAIIGAGIGGVGLAVACLHRNIPFTLYERDISFNSRSQGYGLTLQQVSKALGSFGIQFLEKGVVSSKHVVHNAKGEIIGEWGMRKWIQNKENQNNKNTNIHISRQSLRLELLSQLNSHDTVQWNHQLVGFKTTKADGVHLEFLIGEKVKKVKADLVVGADGIRSTVRNLLLGKNRYPLQYLGCIVILGICPLENLRGLKSSLLDSATVFQTVNGTDRMYMMPYDSETVMWQFSFPVSEKEAKHLSKKGVDALKKEVCKRTEQWHKPIPQIIEATKVTSISGYPVYDRELLTPKVLNNYDNVTLIGDAAHPMSPFKGQGANQALLDALSLARVISKKCTNSSEWEKKGLRKVVLADFESEMLARVAVKVKASAIAAKLLHSDSVLNTCDSPRGR